MLATKIKTKHNNYEEIEEIYIVGNTYSGYFKKEQLCEFLLENPGTIQVNVFPFPDVIPVVGLYRSKHVRSAPTNTKLDNLLSLPRD